VRDRDRWWWLIALIGLALCIASVVVPYFGVRSLPTDNPYFTRDYYMQDVGLMGLLALMFLGTGVAFLVIGARERRHHRQRLAALRGNAGAMPLAEMRPNPAQAPDVTDRPLELLWRTSKVTKLVQGPLLGLYALLALASISVSLFTLLAPIFLPPQPSADDLIYHTLPQPMSVTELVLRIAGAAVVVAVVVVFGMLALRLFPYLFGRPFDVTATDSGMDARTDFGTRIHLGWDEMRLLEVERGDAKATRRFALYAPGKRIAWAEYNAGFGAEYVPAGATASEMTLRQAALLNLIVARTGLAPRTLAKTLEIKSAPTRAAKRASGVAALLVLAPILAGSAAADFFFPLTPVPWINWLSAGSLAFTALFLVAAGLREALTRSRLPAHAVPPSAGAPSLAAPGVAYVLSWRIPLVSRVTFLAFGSCLAVNLVPAAWILLRQLGALLPGFQAQILANGAIADIVDYTLAFLFAAIGMIGLALVYAGLRAATVRIQADKNGLTSATGPLQESLAWSSILSISWGRGAGERLAYLVKSDVPNVQISWPVGPHLARAVPPADGAVPIGPDELAALVAARIGKPIEVGR
jgi:hypothetical protein